MALTYAEKLHHSSIMRSKFQEIKDLKKTIKAAIDEEDPEKYEYMVNIVFSKVSVIEKSIIDLRKLYLERLDEN